MIQKILIILCFSILANVTYAEISNVWDVLRIQLKLDHEIYREEVQKQLHWLINHQQYLHGLSKAEPYMYHIVNEIQKRHLPTELALIPMIESAFNPFAYSRVGASGLWQFMPNTGNDFGLTQDWWHDGRRSITNATNAALDYLTTLYHNFNNNWLLAIAAYNFGEKSIKQSILSSHTMQFWSLQLPTETRNYIPRLLALAEIIKFPQKYHINLPNIPHEPYFHEVRVGSQIDLNQAAQLAGISYNELLQLNPECNRWATSPSQPFKLLIPAKKVAHFYHNLALLPYNKRVNWIKYTVKYGDNLKQIANQYFTTTQLLNKLNKLNSGNIHAGQILLIPSSKYFQHLNLKKKTVFTNFILPQKYKILHIVQSMDTLQVIAQKYHVSTQDITSWNRISMNQQLYLNQQLIIFINRK